jgi:ABC-2 type transport system ATP-binding protein
MVYPVSLKNVVKIYRNSMKVWNKVNAVDDISFDIKEGEIVGFAGHNGAGKTTTIKMMLGFISPTKGEIKIFDSYPGDVKIKKRIGFLPERPYFHTQLTAKELLRYMGKLSGLSGKILEDAIDKNLKKTGLITEKNKKLSDFSKGMLQRIGLAQAILHEPDLLILDEPMSGLDPLGRKDMKNIIRALKKQGKTILFSSHILSDLEDLSDKILIIDHGKIQKYGTLKEIIPQNKINFSIKFSVQPTEQNAVFSKFENVKFSAGIFEIKFSSKEAMNSMLKTFLNEGYDIISAGISLPSLENVVFSEEKNA